MDWLSHGALPIGFLMFFGMIYAFLKRRAGHHLAARAFPDLATRLGLSFKPSPYRGGIGTLRGTVEGYRVFVDPDDQKRMSLQFRGAPSVLLLNYHKNQRPPPDALRLSSGDKAFDAFFKTRFAGDAVSQRIRSERGLYRLVDDFDNAFRRELKQLSVTPDGIALVFDFGNPPHIPASAVSRLLPQMVRLAKLIEPIGDGADTDSVQ